MSRQARGESLEAVSAPSQYYNTIFMEFIAIACDRGRAFGPVSARFSVGVSTAGVVGAGKSFPSLRALPLRGPPDRARGHHSGGRASAEQYSCRTHTSYFRLTQAVRL
jgi:hypothetical protein